MLVLVHAILHSIVGYFSIRTQYCLECHHIQTDSSCVMLYCTLDLLDDATFIFLLNLFVCHLKPLTNMRVSVNECVIPYIK